MDGCLSYQLNDQVFSVTHESGKMVEPSYNFMIQTDHVTSLPLLDSHFLDAVSQHHPTARDLGEP